MVVRLNPVFAFWFGCVMTRPVGASFSDWISASRSYGGLGFGEGPVSFCLTVIIVILVGYLSFSPKDIKDQFLRPDSL